MNNLIRENMIKSILIEIYNKIMNIDNKEYL